MDEFENKSELGETENRESQPSPVFQSPYNNPYTEPKYAEKVGYTPNSAYGSFTEAPKKEKKSPSRFATVVLSVILSLAVSLVGTFTAVKMMKEDETNQNPLSSIIQNTDENKTNNNQSQTITITGNTDSVSEAVYLKAEKSVVGIRTTIAVKNFFSGVSEAKGEGSGVVYTEDGYIITNYHVISDTSSSSAQTTSIEVVFPDDLNNPVSAELVGYNVSADLAVLKIEKTGLTAATLGNAEEVKVGANVVAIGSPGGIDFIGSASFGIVSGLNRSITIESLGKMELIQTDAAINPGNSGGGLFDSKGNLIGITSSKLVNTSIEGMGFAIPIDTVLKVVGNIMENKDNPTPYMGVEIYPYTSEFLDRYQLPAGAAIKGVIGGGPAEKAGIRAGDIIVEFNSTAIKEYTEFSDLLAKCKVGEKVTVKIYRSGRYYTTNVTIGSNNGQ